MKAKHFIALCRRLWAVRDALHDAYLQYDRRRWRALLRREARLESVILNYVHQ